MSKEFVYINAFGRRFTVKKSNKNLRLSYAYYTNLSNKNKNMMAVADEADNIETKDLGEREAAEQIMNSFDTASKAALDLQNVPVNFIKEILKLTPKQVSMLDDMTTSETGALAGRIAHGVTSDDEDIDPKKATQEEQVDPFTVYQDFLNYEKQIMQETGWDLETVESQPFFVLAEILDDKRESNNPNNAVGPMSLTDFIKTGGVSSILEKGG